MNAQSGQRDFKPAGYMLLAVMLFATVPLVLSFGNAQDAPFMFVAILRLGVAIGVFAFLSRHGREIFSDKKIWKTILEHCWNPAMAWATLGCFSYVLLSWSLKYIDVAVMAVLFEMWPLIMVLITAYLFMGEKRYHKTTAYTILLFLLGLLGFVFVVLSQNNDSNSLGVFSRDILSIETAIGVGLVLLATLFAGLIPSFNLKWGIDLAKHSKVTGANKEFVFVILSVGITHTISGFVIGAIGIGLNESVDMRQTTIALFYGACIIAMALILFRLANLKTKYLGINALSYATPIFSLAFLGIATLIAVPNVEINIPHVDYLVIGTAAIVVANLLINFEASIRTAYKSFIIALWGCGVWVYLHTSFVIPDHFTAVEITSILFILLLTFRMDRLVRRTTDEENSILELFRKLATLVRNGKINAGILEALHEVHSHKTTDELHRAYDKIKAALSDVRRQEPAMADEIETELDKLANSKQQGINFGELTALGFIGGVLVVTLLFFEPNNLGGWNGFLVEVSSFVLAAVVVFLFFNVLDLQRDRTREIVDLEKDQPETFKIKFRDATNRAFERGVSIVVCLAITLSFVWLFFDKWIN